MRKQARGLEDGGRHEGGVRLAIVNGWDFEACRAARERLAAAFGVRVAVDADIPLARRA